MNHCYNELKVDIEDGKRVCEDLIHNEDKLAYRVQALEEEVKALRAEKNELRTFVNVIVKEFNNVIDLLNATYHVD